MHLELGRVDLLRREQLLSLGGAFRVPPVGLHALEAAQRPVVARLERQHAPIARRGALAVPVRARPVGGGDQLLHGRFKAQAQLEAELQVRGVVPDGLFEIRDGFLIGALLECLDTLAAQAFGGAARDQGGQQQDTQSSGKRSQWETPAARVWRMLSGR